MRFKPNCFCRRVAFLIALVSCQVSVVPDAAAQDQAFELPPIDYLNTKPHDPVAELVAKMESGEVKLKFEPKHGYLKPLLAELEIPISSQMLVFSKTSKQVHRISPSRPRAVYFNDEVYVGWCQKGNLEIASTDPQQGAIFYSIEQDDDAAKIVRDKGQCIVCHATRRTQDVPGFFVRSVYPNAAGYPNFGSGTFTTDQTSPFEERWGGWYVTGAHGDMRHMGNRVYEEDEVNPDLSQGANRKSLDDLVSTKPYLSPHSDLVALMVLEHQTQMHNAITYANYETRQALHQSFSMNKLLEREPDFVSDSSKRRIEQAIMRVVTHLLMCDEFPLTSPVSGTSDFAKEFEQKGPRDSQGRSLRELDLEKRLFKYPCSYLIYSPSFDALPPEVRQPVVKRLLKILQSDDETEEFSHLSRADCQSILEILQDTKPEFFPK